MRHILALGMALAVLAGCDTKPDADAAPPQPNSGSTASRVLIIEAEKAAVGRYGPNRGAKAEMVSRNPSKTDRMVCGRTKDGEEWVYQRGSDGKMMLLTKEDTISVAAVWPCNDVVSLRRLP